MSWKQWTLLGVVLVIVGIPINIFVTKPLFIWLYGPERPVIVKCPMNIREFKEYLEAIQGIRQPAPLTWEQVKERKVP
jgi:hypothetical protein